MNTINKLRFEIDIIDDEILKLLERRVEIVKKLGDIKTINKYEILCSSRDNNIINRLIQKSSLDNIFIKRIWNIIIDFSKLVNH
tara:strand:- start:2517 stop:2768 length:252 start_codon:yes stop_codon:yes gene_type:complete